MWSRYESLTVDLVSTSFFRMAYCTRSKIELILSLLHDRFALDFDGFHREGKGGAISLLLLACASICTICRSNSVSA